MSSKHQLIRKRVLWDWEMDVWFTNPSIRYVVSTGGVTAWCGKDQYVNQILFVLRDGDAAPIELEHPDVHEYSIANVALTHDGQHLLTTLTVTGEVLFWDIRAEHPHVIDRTEGNPEHIEPYLETPIDTAAGVPLAIVGVENYACLWRLDGTEVKAMYKLDGGSAVSSVALSHDGSICAAGCIGGDVMLWRMGKGERVSVITMPWHEKCVNDVSFSGDALRLASISGDKTVRVWNIEDGSCLHVLRGHKENIFDFMWGFEDRAIVSRSIDNVICVWDSRTGTVMRESVDKHQHMYCMCFNASTGMYVTGAYDGTVMECAGTGILEPRQWLLFLALARLRITDTASAEHEMLRSACRLMSVAYLVCELM